jgi:hypothetical protein
VAMSEATGLRRLDSRRRLSPHERWWKDDKARRETGKIMSVELESMAVAMPEVPGHPNRTAFRGVLTVVDVASKRAPSGSKGHVVLLTRKAAEAALPSLLGMALDYAPTFDRHDVRRKVGVITQAEVVGRNLEISGFLYARDFPDVVEEIVTAARGDAKVKKPVRARGSELQAVSEVRLGWLRELAGTRSWKTSVSSAMEQMRKLTATRELARDSRTVVVQAGASAAENRELGMSYEVTDVELVDNRARVWMLTKVTFTGAAILRRDKAAYPDTWIELST